MVIKALIPLWKRPEVTRICFEGIKRLQKAIDISPVCIYSEDESKALCEEYGFESYYFENNPLGKKLNFGLDRALESKWDYLTTIGSDDILSDELFEIYSKYEGKAAFGVGCIYFYDVKTRKTAFYNGMQIYGCGRMIRKDLIERDTERAVFRYSRSMSGGSVSIRRGQEVTIPVMLAEKFERAGFGSILRVTKEYTPLWSDGKNSGLDMDSEFSLNRKGISVQHVEINAKPLILDIKTETNLHKISEYNEIDFDVLNNFPEGEQIRRLL